MRFGPLHVTLTYIFNPVAVTVIFTAQLAKLDLVKVQKHTCKLNFEIEPQTPTSQMCLSVKMRICILFYFGWT